MAKRLTLPQLKKYDITQKIIESLADAESRAIIFSIIHIVYQLICCHIKCSFCWNPKFYPIKQNCVPG